MDRFNVKDAAELFFRETDKAEDYYEELGSYNSYEEFLYMDEKYQRLKGRLDEMLYNAAKVVGRQKC